MRAEVHGERVSEHCAKSPQALAVFDRATLPLPLSAKLSSLTAGVQSAGDSAGCPAAFGALCLGLSEVGMPSRSQTTG